MARIYVVGKHRELFTLLEFETITEAIEEFFKLRTKNPEITFFLGGIENV